MRILLLQCVGEGNTTKDMEMKLSVATQNERVGVVVLGMHRSGTSALTRVLNLLGCDLPKTLMGALPSNETGHWESLAIAQLNEEILSSAGSNWHDWLAFNPDWYLSPKMAEFKEKAIIALEEEFGRSHLFVLKDPRICRFSPFWLDTIQSAGVRPVVVMPVRNPLEVANSLSKRSGLEPAHGHLLWLRHVLEAESGSRQFPRAVCSYEALLSGWPNLAAGLQNTFDVSWPRMSAQTREEIGGFLSDRLRHHHESTAKIIDDPFLSPWLRETFAIFVRWMEGTEQQTDYVTLDRIRAELNGAAPAFSRLVSVGWHSGRRVKALDAILKEEQDEHSRTQNMLSQRTSEVEELRAQCTQAQDVIAQRTSEVEELRAQCAQAQDVIAQRTSEVEELRAQCTQAQDVIAQRTSEAEELKLELDNIPINQQKESNNEISELKAKLSDRFREIATLTSLLREREGAAQRAEEKIVWFRELSDVLASGVTSGLKGQLYSLMPAPIRIKKQKAKLERKRIFDSAAYLRSYPDVAEAGIDPLLHYIKHGMDEGRRLGFDGKERKEGL